MYQKPKGTYDILPVQANMWQELEKTLRKVSKIYDYREIRTPIFENTDLFHRGVGEETDIVSKETYTFLDRKKRSITLRPEGTAGVVRSYIENKLYNSYIPVQKYFYYGPMFRYERQQKGRYRQFMQFGAEAFGSNNPMLDAEIISYAVSVLKALKIKDVKVHINSIGDTESKELYKNALLEYLKDDITQLCGDCQTRYQSNPLRILDCKIDSENPILINTPKPLDYLNDTSKKHFDDTIRFLNAMGIEYYIDKSLVRGLDYYTHTVFEVKANLDVLGAQNTICGGGRYNNLVKSLGGPDTPGVGFAFGMDRLMFALEAIDFKGISENIHLYFMILGDEQKEDGMSFLNSCRLKGIISDIDFLDKPMKFKFRYAEKVGARFVAIYGEREKQNNQINIKDQKTGEEVTIPKENLSNYIITELMKPSQTCTNCEAESCDDCEE